MLTPEQDINPTARRQIAEVLDEKFAPIQYQIFPNPDYLMGPEERRSFNAKEEQVRKGYR